MSGELLSDMIARKNLSIDRTLEISCQICGGLAKAHEASIVHRDIKPDNIMIGSDGHPRILDFGLAKLRGISKLTREDSTVGTLNYMSPEQARGEDVDHRSDIFSLGAVIYEMITGRRPFIGEHREAVLYSIAKEEPHPLRRYNSRVGDDLERIVSKALAKKTDERYQSVGDMLVDLRSVQKTSKSITPVRTSHKLHVGIYVVIITAIVAVILGATISSQTKPVLSTRSPFYPLTTYLMIQIRSTLPTA